MASFSESRRCLVTGGVGFIGCNLAARLIRDGWTVTLLDNLSRRGSERNLRWLRASSDGTVRLLEGDIRDAATVERAVKGVDVVYHLAGQTAVTISVADPRGDFEANALGTLNVLEAARRSRSEPIVLHASTNKVYGALAHVGVVEEPTRYRFLDLPHGIDESHPLELHSPYGCSKGVADQYVLDYERIYGIRTVVFRQSCIFGPRQLGSEEQGWVAWLLAAAAAGAPITIFGSGKQVRDLLHVDDLVEAYLRATSAIEATAGKAYNIGGGPDRTVSVWREFGRILAEVLERPLEVPQFQAARPGDQRVFVSDTRRAEADFGWRPTISARDGIGSLAAWVLDNLDLFVDRLSLR